MTLPFEVRGQDVTIPGLQEGVETESGRGIAGNLFLIGTDTNPIEIEGTVYVDGDLVIQGPIVPGNRGVFIVRKNIYIVGDVVYDCNGKRGWYGLYLLRTQHLAPFGDGSRWLDGDR